MNCADARLALEAEPGSTDAALAAHVAGCASCRACRADLLAFDERLRAALAVPVPKPRPWPLEASDPPTRPAIAQVPKSRAAPGRAAARLAAPLALAASVAGVAILAGLLWAGFPRESLAADVVAHMAHEPGAWSTTQPLPARRIAQVLERGDVALRPGTADVTYAQSCWFRGRRVPHLVVQTATGPVTVMVLSHESVDATTPFDDSGYRGVIVPAPRGALAVIGRGGSDVATAAARALAALAY